MPSVSKKQHGFMEAIAHSPAFAKKVGVIQSVGKDFAKADKGKKFKGGGMALFKGKESFGEEKKEGAAVRSGKLSPAMYVKGEKSEGESKGAAQMAKGLKSGKVTPSQYAKGEVMAKDMKMKMGGKVKKMAMGGMAMEPDDGQTKGNEGKKTKPKAFAKGGGIEIRGKTRGKIC